MCRMKSPGYLASFALLFCPVLVHPQPTLPQSHPKYQATRKVFDDLIRAIGDGRTRPTLLLLPKDATGRMQVAWFNPRQNMVALEERAYDLCTALGPDSLDALAALIGHELAHYYQDHGWVGDFGNGFADLEVGQTLEDLKHSTSKMIEIETEADYFGGFFGYIAGYNTLGVAPEILAQIYAEYQLGSNLPGYPSLAERQEIARRSAEKLRQMVPVFEGGNRLLLIKKYPESARCFDYIARTFPSREILSGAGAARALEAIGLFAEGQLRFAYPFELDAETRLRGGKRAVEFGEIEALEKRRARLLAEARELFEAARKKDPAYATAYINLSCVADLQGEREEAALWAQKAVQIARDSGEEVSLANARIARGIAHAHADPADEEAAQQDFEKAKAGNQSLALLDLAILNSEAAGYVHLVSGERRNPSPDPEQIDGLSAQDCDSICKALDAVTEVPGVGRSQPAIDIYTKQSESWKGWVIDTGHSTLAFLETQKGYDGQSGQGMRIGTVLAQVLASYGHPTALVAGRQGTYYVCEHARIIFQIDAGGKVQGWMLYSIRER